MRSTSYRFHILAALVAGALISQTTHAGEVAGLVKFDDGKPAIAAEVNGNFTAIQGAVNDNHTRLGTVETATTAQGASITTINTKNTAQDTSIGTLNTTTADHETRITAVENVSDTHTVNMNTLGTTVSGHTTSITSLNTTTGNHTASIATIEAKNADQDASISSLGTTKQNRVNGACTGMQFIQTVNANGTVDCQDDSANNTATNDRVTKLETHSNDTQCPPDMVANGPSCIDKYESSVWETSDAALISKIKLGTATKVDLTTATQRGAVADDYGAACPDTANGCKTDYAVSIAGVTPARSITWFQAAAVCRNSGKRLPTNLEWQTAAFGTPDPGTVQLDNCVVGGSSVQNTGSRSLCVSDVGAFDMVGNLWEYVSDWTQGNAVTWATNTNSRGTGAAYGQDYLLGVQPSANQASGDQYFNSSLLRGGTYGNATGAGVFATYSAASPAYTDLAFGFRCAK